MTSLDDLMQGGTPSAKFPTIGTVVQGVIVAEPVVRQAREFGTGKPQTWDDGRPQENVVITLQTDQREGPNDDGRRSVYVKAWGDQIAGLRAAVQASGGKLAQGGTLAVRYAGDGERPASGFAPKLYEYRYTAPPSQVDGFMQQPQQQQYAPQPQQQQPQGWANGGAQAAPGFGEQAGPAPAFVQQQPVQQQPVQQQQQQPTYTPEQIAAAQAAGFALPGMQ